MIVEFVVVILCVSNTRAQGTLSQFGSLFENSQGVGGDGTGGSISIEGGSDGNPLANIDKIVGRTNRTNTKESSSVGVAEGPNTGGDGGATNNQGGAGSSVFGNIFSNTDSGGSTGVDVSGGTIGGSEAAGGGTGSTAVFGSTIGGSDTAGGGTGTGGDVFGSTIGGSDAAGGSPGDSAVFGSPIGGSDAGGSSASNTGSSVNIDNTQAGSSVDNAGSAGGTGTVISNNQNVDSGIPGGSTGGQNPGPIVNIGAALSESSSAGGQPDPDAAQTAHTWRFGKTHSSKTELWTADAKAFCASNCVNVDQNHCNFPHKNMCYFFYHCYNGPEWGLVQEVCAFGSYYNSTSKQCDHVRNVDCEYEKCRNLTENAMYSWNELDQCNRAYWQCIPGRNEHLMSSPRCCGPKERFDPVQRACVPSICRQACPLNPNERCRIEQRENNLDFVFAYNFTNCREYFKCDLENKAVRQCCSPEERFSEEDGKCILDTTNCEDKCSIEEACPFTPVNEGTAEDKFWYYHDGIKRPCAYGTVFKKQLGSDCYRCLKDESGRQMPDCMMKVDIPFTGSKYSLNRINSNHATFVGDFKMNKLGGGVGEFKSKALVTIQNYHATGNAFKKGFYLNITFKHEPVATVGDKEVLLSTCQPRPKVNNLPSLHIVLTKQNVEATISDETHEMAKLTVPYEPSQINNLIFDVRSFQGSIHTVILTVKPENPAAGKIYTKKQEKGDLGEIRENQAGESPLSIGGCKINQNIEEGFNGEIYHVQISECNSNVNDDQGGAEPVVSQPVVGKR